MSAPLKDFEKRKQGNVWHRPTQTNTDTTSHVCSLPPLSPALPNCGVAPDRGSALLAEDTPFLREAAGARGGSQERAVTKKGDEYANTQESPSLACALSQT